MQGCEGKGTERKKREEILQREEKEMKGKRRKWKGREEKGIKGRGRTRRLMILVCACTYMRVGARGESWTGTYASMHVCIFVCTRLYSMSCTYGSKRTRTCAYHFMYIYACMLYRYIYIAIGELSIYIYSGMQRDECVAVYVRK